MPEGVKNVEVKVNKEKGEGLAEADMKKALGKYAGMRWGRRAGNVIHNGETGEEGEGENDVSGK